MNRIPLALLLLLLTGAAPPQSGRGLMHGYVAFADVSYNDAAEKHLHPKIELRGSRESNAQVVYTATTDDHGAWDINGIGMGEYTVKISFPGYTTYKTELYIPSDFECRLAIMLRKPGS